MSDPWGLLYCSSAKSRQGLSLRTYLTPPQSLVLLTAPAIIDLDLAGKALSLQEGIRWPSTPRHCKFQSGVGQLSAALHSNLLRPHQARTQLWAKLTPAWLCIEAGPSLH